MAACRICDSHSLDLIFDLGNQPWGNGFLRADQLGEEPVYPLQLFRCTECYAAQLGHTVAKEVMFVEHTYVSGTTQSLRTHFREVAQEVLEYAPEGRSPRVLDIGSNDGTQLLEYRALGAEILGIESAPNIAEMANSRGVPTINRFFNEEAADQIGAEFDVISASGVFFHLEELHSACEAVRKLLSPKGIFAVQFIYVQAMQENCAFDQIYHEHLLYYSLESLSTLLRMHGLEIFDARLSPIHGGSIIAFAGQRGTRSPSKRLSALVRNEIQRETNSLPRYQKFASDAQHKRSVALKWIHDMLDQDKIIYGLGAPVKGNTLLNYFKLTVAEVPALIERNVLRRGLFSPGSHIPILLEEEVVAKPDAYLVLAWNFKREILERYANDVESGIEFFFPIDPKE